MLKTFTKIFFLSTFFIIFSQKAYANVDITLSDDKTENEISVLINTNGATLVGVDVPIIFSEDIEIKEVVKTNFCNFFFEEIISDNKVSLECFNDGEIVMEGELATIKYESKSKDYYFYVDSENTDTAGESLGNIVDINKPASTENDNRSNKQDLQYLYILLPILPCLLIIVFIVVLRRRKGKTTEN